MKNEFLDFKIDERDPKFREAAEIVVIEQMGSASFLQRKFDIGYNRSLVLINQLETFGIVGPFEGNKARKVLLQTIDELYKFFDNEEAEIETILLGLNQVSWEDDVLDDFIFYDESIQSLNQILNKLDGKTLTPIDRKNILVALFKSHKVDFETKKAIVNVLSSGLIRPSTPFLDKDSAIQYIKIKIDSNDELVNQIWNKVKKDEIFYKN